MHSRPLQAGARGLCIFVAVAVCLHYSPARLDAWGSGLLVMGLSAAAMVAFVDWEEWLALVVGLWMLAAPWVLGLPHAATKIHVAAGLICVYLAGLELWLVHYHQWERSNPR